jgi:hypothetical protein
MNRMPRPGPRCFLHVPKSAGSSFHVALVAALSADAVSPRRSDTTGFVDFTNFAALNDTMRATVAADDSELAELASFQIVSGHFALPHLLRLTTADRIATIFREPRSRLISLYAYYRLSPWLLEAWSPYDVMRNGQRPLQEFLGDKSLAVETDNQACRLLLHGDARIPQRDFIASDDVDELAAAAFEKLQTLGLVEILELGQSTWQAFGRFFEADLSPVRVNVTAEEATGISDLPPLDKVTPETIKLLEARNAVDSRMWAWVLERKGWRAEEIRRLADGAFTDQMVRLGDAGGSRAKAADQLAGASARLEEEIQVVRGQLRRVKGDLELHQRWLADVQASTSWQLTSPLRAAKGFVRRRLAR